MRKSNMIWKRIVTMLLVFALVMTSVMIPAEDVSAASSKKAVKSVTLKVDSKKVTKKTVTLEKGKKSTIKVTVNPSSAKKKVAFKTDKKKVATVSKKGVVTAKSAGTAKITVTVTGKNNKKKSTWVKVKVTNPAPAPETQNPGTQTPETQTPETQNPGTPTTVEVTSVAFNPTSYTVEKGKTVQAEATVSPANATDKTIEYKSEDEKIATVTPAGIILGVAPGTTTITAKTANGKTATATVTVNEPKVITLSDTKLTIGKNQTANITASVPGVTWSSDNETVAIVDATGKVTGKAAGTANIIATSGTITASCEVIVSQYDPENDGVTLSVFNPIKNNKDDAGNTQIFENTVLVNQDMIIQAYVQKNATPKKDSRVKLSLEEIDSYIVDADDYEIKVNGQLTDTAVTNAEGIAEFTVSYKGKIKSTYDKESDCPYISFNASTLVDNQPNDKDIIVKFASVLRQGIQVDNNRSILLEDIKPFDGHASSDDGIQTTWNTNNYYASEYVTSQQVGNDVYMSASPYFILPPERKATEDKFEVLFPSKKVTTGQTDVSVTGSGETESYSIYNDGTDSTTTTTIVNVPEGLVSMSVFFNRISISKYSQLYIDLYEYDGTKGKNIYSKTYTEFEQEYTKADGVQIKNLTEMKGKGILIVSIQSPGQVDVATTGYSLNKVTGEFNSNLNSLPEKVEVVNAVKWADVTENAGYTVEEEMTYEQITEYLKEYVGVESSYLVDDTNYKFAYRVPSFNSQQGTANAITGNALLTATYTAVDGTVKTATYAYPVVKNEKLNINELMPKNDSVKAIYLGEDVIDKNGNIQQITGGMTQDGNQAVIKSASTNVSGAIFLEARLQIDALNKEISDADKNADFDKHPIKGANDKYPLYSYVQFVAKPEAIEADGQVPTFHAVEDQYIVVTAEVLADNKEKQTDQPIQFFVGDKQITAVEEFIGKGVQVKYLDTKTNNEGKAYLVLVGHEGSYVENLLIKYKEENTGGFKMFNTYAGSQKFEPIKQGKEINNICNLCWLDLGLAYLDDATEKGTWLYSYASGETKETTSESVVDKTWKVGFIPTATCPMGTFKADYAELQKVRRNVSLSHKNLFVDITKVGVKYLCSGENKEANNRATETVKDERAALITSSKIGQTTVGGDLALEDETFEVTYLDSNNKEKKFTTVGVNEGVFNTTNLDEIIDLGGAIRYVMNWTPGNWTSEFIHPYGNSVYKEQDTKVYFRLKDKNDNPIAGKDVVVTATFNNEVYTDFTAVANSVSGNSVSGNSVSGNSVTTKTNEDGLVILDVPAPKKNGDLVFTVNVANGVLKRTSIPVTYVDIAENVAPLQIKGEPKFDKDNHKKMTLTYNNEIVADILTDEMTKKLFVVKDSKGNVLAIEDVSIILDEVDITLKDVEFIEGENYTVEVMIKDEVKINGIVYVMYDRNGQAMLKENATKAFTVKY